MKKEFLAIALLIAAMFVVGGVSAAVGGGEYGNVKSIGTCINTELIDEIALDQTMIAQTSADLMLRSQPQSGLNVGNTNDEGISGNDDLVGLILHTRDSW